MILSRLKPAEIDKSNTSTTAPDYKKKLLRLDQFIADRDYVGAITVLEVHIPLFLPLVLPSCWKVYP